MFLSLYVSLYILTVLIFLLILNHAIKKIKSPTNCPVVKAYDRITKKKKRKIKSKSKV